MPVDYLKNAKQKYKKVDTEHLVAGFLNEKMAYIAKIQEFGKTIKVTDKMRRFFFAKFGVRLKKDTTEIRIPPRPFLQQTVDAYKNKWLKQLGILLAETGDTNKSLSILGEQVVADIKYIMENGDFIKNSPLTVKAKGKDSPLINTGDLRNSVAYDVRKGK